MDDSVKREKRPPTNRPVEKKASPTKENNPKDSPRKKTPESLDVHSPSTIETFFGNDS